MKTRVHSIGLISQALWLSLNISQHYQHHLFVKLRPFISTHPPNSNTPQFFGDQNRLQAPHTQPVCSSKIIKNHQNPQSFGHEIPFTAHFSSSFSWLKPTPPGPSWPHLASHLASHLELKGLRRRRSGVAESQGSGDDAEPDLAMAGYG